MSFIVDKLLYSYYLKYKSKTLNIKTFSENGLIFTGFYKNEKIGG